MFINLKIYLKMSNLDTKKNVINELNRYIHPIIFFMVSNKYANMAMLNVYGATVTIEKFKPFSYNILLKLKYMYVVYPVSMAIL